MANDEDSEFDADIRMNVAPHRGFRIFAFGGIAFLSTFGFLVSTLGAAGHYVGPFRELFWIIVPAFVILVVVFGVLAWSMGSRDLFEICAGRMDPTGKRLTQIGRILGIFSAAFAVMTMVAACCAGICVLIGFLFFLWILHRNPPHVF